MNEGPLSTPLVLQRDGACLREVVARCSCLYRFINFEDQLLSGLAPVAHVKNGLSGSQARNGACRSEGLEWLVAGQRVPDRLGQLSSELDLGDLGAALERRRLVRW